MIRLTSTLLVLAAEEIVLREALIDKTEFQPVLITSHRTCNRQWNLRRKPRSAT